MASELCKRAIYYGPPEVSGRRGLPPPGRGWQVPQTMLIDASPRRRLAVWGALLGPGLLTRNPFAGFGLLPFAVAAVDLFARCRRRRIPVLPAVRSLRSRVGFWLWSGAMFLFLALAGAVLGMWALDHFHLLSALKPLDLGGEIALGFVVFLLIIAATSGD